MSRPVVIGLAVLCAVVLGGAWLGARALTHDVTVSAPPPLPPLPEPAPPAAPPPLPPPVVQAPPPIAPPAPVAPVPPRELAPVKPVAALPPESAGPDFMSERSPEVERAWVLLNGPQANVATWRQAAQVFRRCLVEAPKNARCQKGLDTVTARLGVNGAPLDREE